MSAVYYTLAAIGAFVGLLTVGIVTYLVVAVKLDHRAEAKRRAEQGREVTAQWLALLSPTEHLDSEGYPLPEETEPIYEALCFERWEAEL